MRGEQLHYSTPVKHGCRGVDRSKSRPRARFSFLKPIQSGMRKIKTLIESRPSTADAGLAGTENEVRLQKEE